jgi:hypothetical protein
MAMPELSEFLCLSRAPSDPKAWVWDKGDLDNPTVLPGNQEQFLAEQCPLDLSVHRGRKRLALIRRAR